MYITVILESIGLVRIQSPSSTLFVLYSSLNYLNLYVSKVIIHRITLALYAVEES
jgi:hypothetical protein